VRGEWLQVWQEKAMNYQLKTNMVTLKLLDFSDKDKARFASILTLAERGLTRSWAITNDMSADFFLIKERLLPFMDQHEVLKSLPRQQCIFIMHTGNNRTKTIGHQLYWGESEVPSLRLLVEFLNQLTSEEEAAHPASAQPLIAPESDVFDHEQGFLGYLLAPANTPRAFKLNNEHAGIVLYIDAEQNRYYSNTALEQLKPYFFATDALLIENISAGQLHTAITAQTLKPQPLSHLLWFTAFASSQGKVIKSYQKGDIVHLKRWPNINLPGCKQLVKLAAYMQSNAVDLDTVQANTAIPMAQIHDFYNACKVTGLIDHCQVADIHEKNLSSEQKQLIARIGKRLSQTSSSHKQD